MTLLDLRFAGSRGAEPSDALLLVFGATSGPAPPPPPPPPPPVDALRIAVRAPWRRRPAELAQARVAARWGATGSPLSASTRLRWASVGALLGQRARLPWGVTRPAPPAIVVSPWAVCEVAGAAARLPWQMAQRLDVHELRMPWRGADAARQLLTAHWRAPSGQTWGFRSSWRAGDAAQLLVRASASRGLPDALGLRAPWRRGLPLQGTGGSVAPPPPVDPTAPTSCRTDDPSDALQLLFQRASGDAPLDLVFWCWRPSIVVVPVRRFYMVTNTATLVRVDNDAEIDCPQLQLSLDADSWAWQWSATVPASAAAALARTAPDVPVELQATVNGTSVRVLLESMQRDRVWPTSRLVLGGRGKTALLADPYQAQQTWSNASGSRTSQQLLDDTLPVGWSCDWQLTPWLVPAGVWLTTGTPISVAADIAGAGGGYLQPHPIDDEIIALPRYPAAPWAWGSVTPDIELPADVVATEAIQWIDRPLYNQVYVSGTTTGGRLVRVRRDGTAGDLPAPMVTHPLITHVDAGMQRGLPVLADVGSQAIVTINTLVLPETGIIVPGKFVRYVEGLSARLGLTRGVSVAVARQDKELTVRQTIRMETHT